MSLYLRWNNTSENIKTKEDKKTDMQRLGSLFFEFSSRMRSLRCPLDCRGERHPETVSHGTCNNKGHATTEQASKQLYWWWWSHDDEGWTECQALLSPGKADKFVKAVHLMARNDKYLKMIKQPKWTGSDTYWNTITKVYLGVSYTRSTWIDKLN